MFADEIRSQNVIESVSMILTLPYDIYILFRDIEKFELNMGEEDKENHIFW